MIYNLEEHVNLLYRTPSDINQHFPTMVKYGSQCATITEMGVRGIFSTWAWLACLPKKLTCYDIELPSKWGGDLQSVYDTAKAYNIEFEFIQADVLKVDIEETDLLFIDTWHAYHQLKAELKLHAKKVKKFICFHDTTLFEFSDEIISEVPPGVEPTNKGLRLAIDEFLNENPEWVLEERFNNNNGLTVIKRKLNQSEEGNSSEKEYLI